MIEAVDVVNIDDIKEGRLVEDELLDYVTCNDLEIALAVANSQYSTEVVLDIAPMIGIEECVWLH